MPHVWGPEAVETWAHCYQPIEGQKEVLRITRSYVYIAVRGIVVRLYLRLEGCGLDCLVIIFAFKISQKRY